MKPTEPLKIVKPPRAYPEWLKETFKNQNAPVPESELEKLRTIDPRLPRVATPGRIFGAHEPVPAKIVPPPQLVLQKPQVMVKFKVLNVSDRPIFGFSLRVNDKNLVTNTKGEATTNIYQGHILTFSTGRESGWSFPNGARRKQRMTGLVPIAQYFTVEKPSTVLIYPQSGEYTINGGRTLQQAITYTTS